LNYFIFLIVIDVYTLNFFTMKRKEFLGNVLKGTAAVTLGTVATTTVAQKNELPQVGFNHLPNKEIKTMKSILHKADSRGGANHGWLDTKHSFSFANYYNPERMNFGVLRVLNDDKVSPGMGFGTHPHDNMEIISIPLEGDLEHKDSMGNTQVIKENDIQIMSAGSGIYHSEKNRNLDKTVRFLQIWVFPKEKNITPRYDQRTFSSEERKNKLLQIISPATDNQGIDINQDAWFSIEKLEKGVALDYKVKKQGNGVYAFVIEGDVTVENQPLNRRDGFGVWDVDSLHLSADSDTEVLLMEVPMTI
jgi:quercetin 2,3-dioxygenase